MMLMDQRKPQSCRRCLLIFLVIGLIDSVFHNQNGVSMIMTAMAEGPLGIPGATQTDAGYDTEMGTDPVCWSSLASPTPDVGIPFPNGELVENFTLSERVELLSRCPNGTWLEIFSPKEFLDPEFRPRTLEWYNYTVTGRIDIENLNGYHIVSDEGRRVAISLIACDSARAGFCSPFVHEQANLREAIEKEELGYTLFAAKKVTGDRHGGTHVHAPAVVLDFSNSSSTVKEYSFAVQVPMIINDPGTFFVIGTLQFFMGNETSNKALYRYDVANAVALEESERLVTYQEPANILAVSKGVRIVSYVTVGLACVAILFLLGQSIKHYKSQVLRISQAPFLVAFLVAALIASGSSLLFDPRNDITCELRQPLVLISLQVLFAVTLGRLWRIHAVVSPLLRNRLQKAPTSRGGFRQNFLSCLSSRRANFRKEITNTKVVFIAILCTLPQVILQVLAIILQPSHKAVDYNDDESVGRCVCDAGVETKKSIELYALLALFVLILVLLFMAHLARQLPSLLNESAIIYDVTLTSILLAVLGVGIILVTDDPTISPDVSYMVYIVLVLSITLNSSLRIMMPKLRMIWNGETVLVSKLVEDHKQSLVGSSRVSDRGSLMYNVTGLSATGNHDQTSSMENSFSGNFNNSLIMKSRATDGSESNFISQSIEEGNEAPADPTEEPSDSSTGSKNKTNLENAEDTDVHKDDSGDKGSNNGACEGKDPREVRFEPGDRNAKGRTSRSRSLLVKEGEAPNRKLTVKMLDLHDELDVVIDRIMSGLAVDRQDWEKLRDCTVELDEVFSLVKFDWEESRDKDDYP